MSLRAQLYFPILLICGLLGGAPQFALGDILSESEPNDDFDIANTVTCGDTVQCATVVWGNTDYYRVLMSAGDSLYVRTAPCNGSDFRTLLVLYSPDHSIIDVDQNGGVGDFSLVRCWATTAGWYTVMTMSLEEYTVPDSAYNLICNCRSPEPENFDFCETARVIPQLPYYDEGDTFGRADNGGTPAPDVFYQFTQPILSDIQIEVCAEFFDARVQILGGCLHDFMDDASTGCQLGATLTSYGVAPGEYYIMVEGTSQFEAGQYSIYVQPSFPECPSPEQVVVFDIGGLPSLDWLDVPEADYYLIRQSTTADGPYQNLDTTFISFYQDPAGFAAQTRFYQVQTVCPWGN